MSKIQFSRAAAMFAAIALALALNGSDIIQADAQAAPAPARPATAPGIVISNPPAGPAIPPPTAPIAAAPAAAAAGGPAAPRIVVIDRAYILQRSSAGQDMMAQVQNLTKQAETQFKTEETQLAGEATQLQQQLAILAPDVREQKEKDFTTKQQAFQGRVAQRQAEIQAGFGKAARQVEVALEPILRQIMTERNANMVMDRSAVILSTVDIDVTPVAVQRLDKVLPKVKVELTAAPAPVAGAAPPRPAAPVAAAPAPARR